MMKYDFEMSIDPHTSLGKIVRHIKAGSRVLEFGPGNGRMTNYLKNEKNCQVSIVEFDAVLFQHVMQFAVDGFLGNIEEYLWQQHFAGQSFDYIVFADVLEHLTDSEKALASVKAFLAEDGEILITFPNLAHNSVMIDLFNNKLDWKDFGLLDQTHNSFYTEDGFKKWFDSVGLYIKEQDFTYSQVGQNEIAAAYEDLPERVRYAFKMRPFGEVYQYFYALTAAPVDDPILRQPENSHFIKKFFLEFVYVDGQREYRPVLLNTFFGDNQTVTLDFDERIQIFRIVPAENVGCIVHFSLEIDGKPSFKYTNNAVWNDGETFLFMKNGEFRLQGSLLRKRTVTLHLAYEYYGRYPELEFSVLEDSLRQQKEIQKLYEEMLNQEMQAEQKMQGMAQRYQKVVTSKSWQQQLFWHGKKGAIEPFVTDKVTLENVVQYFVESVEIDPERHVTIIKGWGFDKKNKQPLNYEMAADEGIVVKVTPLLRKDVNDMYEMDDLDKRGFIIEIPDFHAPKYLHLTMTTADGKKVTALVRRDNPTNIPLKTRIRSILGLIRRKGLKGTLTALEMRRKNITPYDLWREKNETYDLAALKQTAAAFKFQPKISIVTPVYNVEEKWLEVFIQSLENQIYPNWELCLADDCSTESYIRPLLEQYAAKDDRIKVVFREQNGHISEATNSAIALATGDYIGFSDNDDELAPDTLFEVVKALNENPAIDFIYTDEDKVDVRGNRFDPFFKPDWNPELLLGHNYITHFVVVERSILDKIGGLRNEYNGSQDYDFVLRATEKAQHIHHIPKILYHWRTVETSTAFSPETKEYAYIAGQHAIEDALQRRRTIATVKMTNNYGAYKVNYRIPANKKASIILSGDADLMTGCVETINRMTDFSNYEILLPAGDYPQLEGAPNVRVMWDTNANELAKKAEGDYLIFLKNTLLPKNSDWLIALINYARNPETGAVGGKIVNESDVIINAGITLSALEKRQPFEQRGVSNKTLGYYFRIALPRNIYAVTEDCLCVKRADFEKVHGFDMNLPDGLRGVHLCNQLRVQCQLRNVWEPYTILVDHGQHLTMDSKAIQKYFDNEGAAYQSDPFHVTHSLD